MKFVSMASKNESRSVNIYIDGQQGDQTLKQLRASAKLLSNELANLPRNTQAFKDKMADLRTVNAQLKSIKDDVNGVGGAFGWLKTEIGQLGVLATGFLGFQFLTAQFHNVISANAALSDSIADIQKTTGLSEMAVRRLSASFKEIDTRTSKKELLDLAEVAGKLGISGEKDVLGFVRAANQIGVTLGKALGGNTEEAINDIGKIVEVFHAKDTYGLEQSLLKTGSAINALGNAGTANEGYIVEFTKRLGGIAPAANMSLQNVMGLATVFDELGQPVEASATAIGKLMVMIGTDVPKYANIAGMSIDQFNKLLNTDGNAALVAVLKNVKTTSGGIADLAAHMGLLGEDASRSITAIGALSNNLGLLQQRQKLSNDEFDRGMGLTDQYNIKNNNFGAMLDKLSKKFSALTSNLSFVDFLVKATKATGDFIDMINRNIGVIVMLVKFVVAGTAAYLAYNAVLLVAKFSQAAFAATLLESEALFKLVTLAEMAMSVVTLTLTGRLKEARQAMIVFDAVLDANPIGIVAGAIAALITGLYLFNSTVEESVRIQQSLNDITAEAEKSVLAEKMALEAALKATQNRTNSKEQEAGAVKKLRDLMPDHLKDYTDEAIVAGKATEAINKHIDALESEARATAAKNKMVQLQSDIIDIQSKDWDKMSKWEQAGWNVANRHVLSNKSGKEQFDEFNKAAIAAKEAESKQIEERFAPDINKTNAPVVESGPSNVKVKRTVTVIEAQIAALQQEQKQVSATSAEWKKYQVQIDALTKEKNSITGGPKTSHGKDAEDMILQSKRVTDAVKAFNAQQLADTEAKNEKEIDDKKNEYDTRIAQIKIFQQKVAQNTKLTDAQKKKLIGVHQDEINQLVIDKKTAVDAIQVRQERDLVAKIKELRNSLDDAQDTELQKETDRINKFYDDQLVAGYDKNEVEIARAKDLTDAKLREEKRFQEDAANIDAEGAVTEAQKNKVKLAQINKKYDDEITALKRKYSKELQATKEFQDKLAQIEKNRKNELNQNQGLDPKDLHKMELQAAIEGAQEISNAVFEIGKNNRQADTDARIKTLEDQRSKELSNTHLTETQKAAINQKFDRDEAAIKLKAWQADKTAQEEQILINGAIAIAKLYAEHPLGFLDPVFDIALGGILINTALQEAVVANTKPPAFEDGGYSSVDYKKPQGYVRSPTLFANSASGRSFTAGEKFKTEYIVSSDQLKDPVVADFVNTMESHRGVRRFEAGGYSNATIRVSPSKTVSNSTQNSTGSDRLDRIEETLHTFIVKQAAINEIPITFNNTTFDIERARIAQIKNDATT